MVVMSKKKTRAYDILISDVGLSNPNDIGS